MDRLSIPLQINDTGPHPENVSDHGQVSTLAARDKKREIENKKNDEIFDTRSVIKTLDSLMTKVTKDECTPETVNAACNAADKITQLLRVHLDVEKFRRKYT